MASRLLKKLFLLIVFLSASMICAMPLEDRQVSFMDDAPSGLTDIWDTCYEDLEKQIAHCRNRRLHAVPDNLSPHTLELDLSENFLPALLENSFTRYSYLTTLNVRKNNISSIHPRTFYPLKLLENLYMDDNPIGDISSGEIFRYCSNLQTIFCEYCEMKKLPSNFLDRLPNLVDLWLNHNELTFISLTSCPRRALTIYLRRNHLTIFNAEHFHIPCKLAEINVELNPFQEIDIPFIESLSTSRLTIGDTYMPLELFDCLFHGIVRSSVEELSIRFASLPNITENFFDEFHNFHFALLELSIVELEYLYPSMFSKLNRIDEFSLSDNHIAVIEPEYFTGMQNLQILKLDWNEISVINPKLTQWQIGLSELHLLFNRLKYIDSSSFLGLSNLTFLDLSYNPLISLDLDISYGISQLQNLDISSTCPRYIFSLYTPNLKSFVFDSKDYNFCGSIFTPGKTFENTQFLENIDLRNSHTRIHEIWDSYWGVSLFEGLIELKYLDLSGNELSYLPSGVFMGLQSMEILNLDYCEMEYIERNSFAGLGKLVTLNMRYSKFTILPPRILSDLKQLRSIQIGGNSLTFLEDDIFENNTLIQNLTLFKNQFATLNKTTFDPIKSSVDLIDISENPFNCTCQMAWLADWLVGLSMSSKVENEEKTICEIAQWDSMEKKPLATFDTFELCGEHFIGHRNNIPYVCLGVLAVMIIYITFVTGYRNRWLLKYRVFLLKTAILGHGEIHVAKDRLDYEYDLNVIFFDDDEEWVRDHLRPALEEKLPNFDRNVFGGEDLPLGMHYMDATHYVIENSFKTIFLLSRAAVRDNWHLIKFRAAVELDGEDNNAGNMNTIVVFLDNIPDEELPYMIRLYLSDNRPYLKWVADATGQEYFWIELTKHLTFQLRQPDAAVPQ